VAEPVRQSENIRKHSGADRRAALSHGAVTSERAVEQPRGRVAAGFGMTGTFDPLVFTDLYPISLAPAKPCTQLLSGTPAGSPGLASDDRVEHPARRCEKRQPGDPVAQLIAGCQA
jgi:hypothetical protein